MNAFSRILALGLALTTTAVVSSAQIVSHFDFDSLSAGSLANAFATPQISFHQASYIPAYDEFGDAVTGSEHWAIDSANDALTPVTVENPEIYFRVPAPSGLNALQALWQPILIGFNQSYRLSSFSLALDNDTFGGVAQIYFVHGNEILRQLTIDQGLPGLEVTENNLGELTGIVLPAGAFYDNLSLTLVPVPEPATYGLLGAIALLGLVGVRRIRSRK